MNPVDRPIGELARALAALDFGVRPVVGRHAGLVFASAFQPIYSLAHGRVVGHEALLRATDACGAAVAPQAVFAVDDPAELHWRDRLARAVHAANYFFAAPPGRWLFLNIDPRVLGEGVAERDFWVHMAREHGVRANRVVVEVTEAAAVCVPHAQIEAAIAASRAAGCLIALDDFGAGHSNFERIWRYRPDVVKLDRSLVVRAAADTAARRIVVQMVTLLHECGTLVLMEGIETEAEAVVALESDVDLVQGYFFGRPAATLETDPEAACRLERAWQRHEHERDAGAVRQKARCAPFVAALEQAAAALAGGAPFEAACAAFLNLPDADVCYLLDAQARQVGRHAWAGDAGARVRSQAPLIDTLGARWTRRPYFTRAMRDPGRVQLTRPYRTLHGGGLCLTASLAYPGEGGALHVVCGDVRWEP